MKLFLKLWQFRIKMYFSKGLWKRILLDLFLISIFLYAGFLISMFFNKSYVNQNNIPKGDFIKLLCVFLFETPILVKIIFSDFTKKFKYTKNFPGSILRISTLDLFVFGLLDVKNSYVLFFLLSFFIGTFLLSGYAYLLFIFFSISGILIAENIKNAITFRNLMYFSILTFTFLSINIILIRCNIGIFGLLAISVLCSIGYFFSYLHFYELSGVETKQHNPVLSSYNIYLSLILRKKTFKKSIITSFIFKFIIVFFLIVNLNAISLDDSDRALLLYVLYAASMPLGIFTYMFNNVWGYYKSFALNLIISSSSLKRFLYSYLRLLVFPIFYDFIFSSFLLIIAGYFKLQFLLYYSLFCLFAFPIGFLASLLKYKEINKGMSFTSTKTNASVLVNILTLVGLVPIFFLSQNLLIGFCAILALILPSLILFISFKSENRILQYFKNRILLMRSA